jgi:hypothetical protein
MKHLSNIEGIDFVNKVMPLEKQAEIQKHLDSGCQRCIDLMATWQHVRQAGAGETNYQPPAGALRIAKAAFAAAGMGTSPGTLNLLFDSVLQPAVAGLRSFTTDACTRQVLYGAGPYLLDLYICARSEGKLIGVTGQLLNSKHPELFLSSVPVVVSNRNGDVNLALTNQFGEFHGEVENMGDLELRLPTAEGRDIVVPLGCLVVGLVKQADEVPEEGQK